MKIHLWKSVKQLFNETGRLISEQTEITGVHTIAFKELTWMSTSFLCGQAYQYTSAKAYVFSDSVLCAEKMGDDPVATWKSRIGWFSEKQSLQGYESNRRQADGVPMDNIHRNHNVGPPREDSKSDERSKSVNLSTSKTGSSSCQCTMTLNVEQEELQKDVNTIHRQLRVLLVNSLAVIGFSRSLDQKRNNTELTLADPTDLGTKLQNKRW